MYVCILKHIPIMLHMTIIFVLFKEKKVIGLRQISTTHFHFKLQTYNIGRLGCVICHEIHSDSYIHCVHMQAITCVP